MAILADEIFPEASIKSYAILARFLILLTGFSVLLMGCGTGKIEAHQAWVRAAMKGENSAVYFILHNHSSQPDELIGVACDCAQVVELHESVMEAGAMKMKPVTSIPLASGAEVNFQPGGLHVMLINLSRDLKAGDSIDLVLKFKHTGALTIKVPVREAGSGMEGGDSHHQHTP